MLTDLYDRAHTDTVPTQDCYCGTKLMREYTRPTVVGEWAYRFQRMMFQDYNVSDGEPHHCSEADMAAALKHNQRAALRVWFRMSQQPGRK